MTAWLVALWTVIITHWQWITVALLPFVANAVARCDWTDNEKGWTAVGVSVVYGILAAFVAGIPFAPANLLVLLTAVIGGTTLAYRVFEANHVTAGWLERILAWRSPK